MRHIPILLWCITIAACGRAVQPPPPMTPDPYAPIPPLVVSPSPNLSLDSILASLTLEERVGQVVMPWLLGNYAAFDDVEYDTLDLWIDSLHIGGISISVGSPLEVALKLNTLQRRSRLPLLVSADLEWGSAMRLRGGTAFPMPMGIAATGRELDAYELGRVTAAEARAVGIHWTFSPVADLNSNPDNPVINTRSFGEDPGAASRFIAAYVRGAREHGVFTTAKHFPGHGDTDVDSHLDLPVVSACWERLDSLELVPFRAAIDAGVTAVMTAHLALPCLADSTRPATLSPTLTTDVLRDSLQFHGTVVTDALSMGAIVRRYGPGESAVLAFEAGADVLLYPADPAAAVRALREAVHTGRVSEARLDRSVRRILALKAAAGLFGRRTVPLDSVPAIVGRREFQEIAQDIAARSVTLVQAGPIDAFRAQPSPPTAVVAYAEESNLGEGATLVRELRARGETISTFRLYPASGTASYDSARSVIASAARTVFAVSVRTISGRGTVAMPDSLAALISATAAQRPTVVASLGSPYVLRQLPGYTGGYLVAWSDIAAAEQAVASALTGAAIGGHLPTSLGPAFPRGFGIELAQAVDTAGPAPSDSNATPTPARSGVLAADQRRRLAWLHRYLAAEADSGAFPGGVLLVGLRGRVADIAPFGHYGVDDPTPVSDTTIYDLASLTKVIGLTTAVMMLVDEGRIDLDRPVQSYVPAFRGPGKNRVLVRHLLTHTSGLPAWVPLHLTTPDRDAALLRVDTTSLESAPGARYVYSDLGAITLTQIVERVSGEPLDVLLERRLFRPLGMSRTRYRPPPEWRPAIAPTERDPWRGRELRGEVHDENAAWLGGVSGHAGLFSTAPDLARFAFWLLDAWHGRLGPADPVRLPQPLVRQFTTRQPGPEGSTRALGWDTPSPSPRASSGSLLSPQSFGHTGFTGTSIWIDPTRDLVIILLTNRVHPTRDNTTILRVRPVVADSVSAIVGR